jgi:hypothetical protein
VISPSAESRSSSEPSKSAKETSSRTATASAYVMDVDDTVADFQFRMHAHVL